MAMDFVSMAGGVGVDVHDSVAAAPERRRDAHRRAAVDGDADADRRRRRRLLFAAR